jgi:two-component system NtrC family response regulator
MATAAGDAQTAVEAMKAGAYDYITKPFNRDDVVLKVQKAVEKRDLLWHLLKNLETPD